MNTKQYVLEYVSMIENDLREQYLAEESRSDLRLREVPEKIQFAIASLHKHNYMTRTANTALQTIKSSILPSMQQPLYFTDRWTAAVQGGVQHVPQLLSNQYSSRYLLHKLGCGLIDLASLDDLLVHAPADEPFLETIVPQFFPTLLKIELKRDSI